jgi:putative transposase
MYEFIRDHSDQLMVTALCRTMGVSPSAYYRWKAQPSSEHKQTDDKLLERIKSIYQANRGVYGSPRIHNTLHDNGIRCARKRVARLMREHAIRAKTARRFRVTTQRAEEKRQCVDLICRDFHVQRRDYIWTSDITYLWTREGWVYLAVVMDLYSRRVVGWELSARITTELVTNAIERALAVRAVAGELILHSDRGCQYTSREVHKIAEQHGIRQSYAFSCYDNAVTESFFHTLKTEHIRFETFETRDQVRTSLFDYIEIFYNRQRKHSAKR